MGQHWSVVGVRSHMVIVLSIVVVCGWRREWISWLWLGHSFNFDNCACPSLLSLSMDFPSCPPISAHVLAYIPTQPHSLQANLNPYNVVFFVRGANGFYVCGWATTSTTNAFCSRPYLHNLVSFLRWLNP